MCRTSGTGQEAVDSAAARLAEEVQWVREGLSMALQSQLLHESMAVSSSAATEKLVAASKRIEVGYAEHVRYDVTLLM